MIVTNDDVTWGKELSNGSSATPASIFDIDPNSDWSFHTSTDHIKLPFVDDPDDDDEDLHREEPAKTSELSNALNRPMTCTDARDSYAVSLIEKEIMVAVDDDHPPSVNATNGDECECCEHSAVDHDEGAVCCDDYEEKNANKDEVKISGKTKIEYTLKKKK
jgi:hypothetical protein